MFTLPLATQRLGISLCKFDEMECLIRGLHFLCRRCRNECYYWRNPKEKNTCKVPFQLGPNPYPYIIVNIGSGVSILLVESATSFRRIGGTSVGECQTAPTYKTSLPSIRFYLIDLCL